MLVVCYVNVFLVVIYVKKDIVVAHQWDAVAMGLHTISQDGMVLFFNLRTGWKSLHYTTT